MHGWGGDIGGSARQYPLQVSQPPIPASESSEPSVPVTGSDVPEGASGLLAEAPGAEPAHRPVLVVDFGAQYAQLIARRVREANVYSEIVPHTITAAEVAEKNPSGIVLSGGPSSVYEPGSPSLDPAILELGVPVLGICYGFQVMAQQLGGEVANTGLREYGATDMTVTGGGGSLLAGQPEGQT